MYVIIGISYIACAVELTLLAQLSLMELCVYLFSIPCAVSLACSSLLYLPVLAACITLRTLAFAMQDCLCEQSDCMRLPASRRGVILINCVVLVCVRALVTRSQDASFFGWILCCRVGANAPRFGGLQSLGWPFLELSRMPRRLLDNVLLNWRKQASL